ncbi:MAG: TadE family protein [Planctomycetota bacterium]
MNSTAFSACLPWIVCVVLAVIALRILIAASGAKLQWRKLRQMHRCQKGTVQSLSFVLTLPFFVMILMLIVQASQIMIGNMIVHYAAYATARSAIVWIPTTFGFEGENQISSFDPLNVETFREIDDFNPLEDQGYDIVPSLSSPKFAKIRSAAIYACLPLGPSADYGYSVDPLEEEMLQGLLNLYRGLDAESDSNFDRRIRNKLAYTSQNIMVRLRFWHRQNEAWPLKEPPLQTQYGLWPDVFEFANNELGWQDHLTARVEYNLPLLPGPVRFFAPRLRAQGGPGIPQPARTEDGYFFPERVDSTGQTYVWNLFAEATMGIEGEKPILSYVQGRNQ